jgi:glycosyltransferase involved in cell wall biosynthesis
MSVASMTFSLRGFPSGSLARWGRNCVADAAALIRPADVALFHEFAPSPAGGGHQFLRALWREFERRGWRVGGNAIARTSRACLFNSYNFDFERLRRKRRHGCRMVHRVDGPLAAYRGSDDGTDRRIWEINRDLAEATVFQSRFSLAMHRELGFEFVAPTVIPNAADPAIFHRQGREPFSLRRPARIIAVSWSDNPNKGAEVYRWLDANLDRTRYAFTFVGRLQGRLPNSRQVAPVASADLAALLRGSDIYVTASRNDPCSNSLIEALACGLPAVHLDSGGHAELAGDAGLAFRNAEEVPALLDRIRGDYDAFQGRIRAASIAEVAEAYLRVMGLGSGEA